MKILEQRIYRGPNLYAHFPVVRLRCDLGELERWPSAKIPGFVDALLTALPSLEEHGCSYSEAGGFIRRMREGEGTWLGHVLEHVAIEIQNLAGADVTFGKTRGTGTDGEYFVVYQFEEERVGEAAGKLALRLLHSLIPTEQAIDDDKAGITSLREFRSNTTRNRELAAYVVRETSPLRDDERPALPPGKQR
jgi:cyanophycin synthetase